MKRTLILCVAALVGALMLTASANANEVRKAAKQACKAEKKAEKKAFKAVYGKQAMRTCVKGAKPEARADIRNASQECRAEREADRGAFKDAHGNNESGQNAFGKCVSSKVKQARAENTREFRGAARDCREERAADRDDFRDTYGNNRNGQNAFGKCVSKKVRAAENGDDAS